MDGQPAARSWSDILLAGVGGIIDSQRALDYTVADPTYNTAGGYGGQPQRTLSAQISSVSPVVWIVLAVAVVGVVVLARR